MDNITQALLMGAAGSQKTITYVDDLFHTYVWLGTSANHQVTNNIDNSGEGGMVWMKKRNSTYGYTLFDTVRGTGKMLQGTHNTDAQATGLGTSYMASFNTNGYTIGANGTTNYSGESYVGWNFRKATGFFDIQEYAGDGNDNKVITHDLGSVPGCIIIKNLDSTYGWYVYHRSLNGGTNPEQYFLRLDTNGAEATSTGLTDEAPTATQFKLGDNVFTNKDGDNYIAYIFAHDEEVFGESGDQSVIKCASYTGNGSSTGPDVNLGWEPQWLLIRRTASEGWMLIDNIRGIFESQEDPSFEANYEGAENPNRELISLTATGFKVKTSDQTVNSNGDNYTYIAIRRPDAGVGKTPEAGTDVFAMDTGDATASNGPDWDAPFPVDFAIITEPGSSQNRWTQLRNAGTLAGRTHSTSAWSTNAGMTKWDHSDGIGGDGYGTSYQAWMWKRAPGFFDCHVWTGTGGDSWFNHGLGVVPEMMWFHHLDNAGSYDDIIVYHKDLYFTANSGNTGWPGRKYIKLNSSDAQSAGSLGVWNYTEPTATQFKLGGEINSSGDKMMICLFASCPGVSKVGMYQGTSPIANRVITTGFQPRFIMIKRIDGSGEWIVLDSLRGITDKRLELNTQDAQNTDSTLSVQSDGFTITEQSDSEINTDSGSKYLYYAIA